MLLKTIRKFLKKFHLFGCHQKKNDEFTANQSTVPRPAGATYGRTATAKSNHEFIEFKLSEYFVLTAATILWLHFYRPRRDPATRNTVINKKNRKNMVWTGMSWDLSGGKLLLLTLHVLCVCDCDCDSWRSDRQRPGHCATICNKCALITLGVKLRWR